MGTHDAGSGGATVTTNGALYSPTVDVTPELELSPYSPTTKIPMSSSSAASSPGGILGLTSTTPQYHHHVVHQSAQSPSHLMMSLDPSGHSKKTDAEEKENSSNLRIKSVFVRRYLKYNPVINCLLPISCICALVVIVYLLKDFPKHALVWLEQRQEANSWTLVSWFMVLFCVVSFPVTVGYLVLIITSGYLFGFFRGLLVVVVGANFGVAVAHYVIKSFQNKLPVHKLIKNETGRAILRVIAGPRAFKVVLFCRLTPIPFGLQNTIFGVSSVGPRSYHTATLLGLLPAQTINVYLGSTLRSMRDVLHDHKTAFAGYAVFAVEVIIGVLLMVWVVQKAKIELSNALLADIGAEEKLLTVRITSSTSLLSPSSLGSGGSSPRRIAKKIVRLTKTSFRPLRHLLTPIHKHLHRSSYKSRPFRTV